MPNTVTMKWYGDKILRQIEAEVDSRLEECGQAVAEQMRENVSEQGPPASLPGQYPHAVSRELHDSIRSVKTKKGEVRVVATAEHAPHVEKIRPFFRRTHREMRSKMRAIMLGKTRGSGRFKFAD